MTIIAEQRTKWMAAVFAGLLLITISCGGETSENNKTANAAPKYTYGTIVDETVTVPAGDYITFDINLNRKASINGRFYSENYESNFGMMILDEENFKKFEAGEDYKHVVSAGVTPGGRTNRNLEPGIYKIILDNRHQPERDIGVIASFTVDRPI